MSKLEIAPGHESEIKALIEAGDVRLADTRLTFKENQGRDTTCNDAQLIRALAATDDDDNDLLVKNILLSEQEPA